MRAVNAMASLSKRTICYMNYFSNVPLNLNQRGDNSY